MKPGGQYRKGSRAERAFLKLLKENLVVESWGTPLWAARTPGSKSKFDVTGWWSDCVRGFQIKRGVGRIDDEEMIFLTGIARATVGISEVYTILWPDYETPTLHRVR